MENKASVITVPHKENCQAVQWVKDNPELCPSEWNVWIVKPVPCCDNNGKENPEGMGGTLYYEFICADDSCPSRKRVHAQAVVQL
jgi:hypothetical protein